MRLQQRLLRIAGCVPSGSVVADIGTDHALLPAYLVRQGICPRVIATDLHMGPLAAARSNIALFNLGKQVELRRGDGLAIFQPGEIMVIIIAGMGGGKIIEILDQAPDVLQSASRLILQPLSAAAQVRGWLIGNGWGLTDEDLVQDNERYYEIIVADHWRSIDHDLQEQMPGPGDGEDIDLLLEVGPRLVEKRHPLLADYLNKQVMDMESVLVALRRAQTPAARQRRQEWARKIAYYKKVIKEVAPARPGE